MIPNSLKNILFPFLLTTSFFLCGCQDSDSQQDTKKEQDTLFQYSVLSTLLQGVYDGNMSCSELKEHGDFGLGTFNAIDGEMVVYENKVYQVASDGVARIADNNHLIPFAAVTHFEADEVITLKQTLECSELKTYIDQLLPTKNIAYAIKINGQFDYIKTRSVPKQSKPYPVLVDVLKTQPTFEFYDSKGTIIGFRLPSFMSPANASGYHFHFLTEQKNAGGHLLECRTEDVTIELDYTDKWQTLLPSDSEFYNVNITDESYQ